ncbi:MAG: serine/threonine protein kinase, partial [Myxococcales bacterium]|nr:serine/threonine protein kinase [Myxococcales bacterium]
MVDTPGSNVVRLDWHRARAQEPGQGTSDDDPTIAVRRDDALNRTPAPGDDDPTISRERPEIPSPPSKSPSSSSSWISYEGDDDPTVSREPSAAEREMIAAAQSQRQHHTQIQYEPPPAIGEHDQDHANAQPPKLLDRRYQLIGRIAVGGMGEVWEAHQVALGRSVAIKFLSHEEGGPRFRRAAQAIVAVNHERVVDVLDFGETEDGVPYFVMELLRGQPLDRLIQRQGGPLPWASVRRIGLEIADALAHAHAVGVIHRDLKPSNVLLLDDPPIGGSSTKLLDFGIAKLLDENQPKLTKTGYIQGTP